MVMGIGGKTLPPSVAQMKVSRSQRASMLSTVPTALRTIDEFRDGFYEALDAGQMTGRRLGSLLWRMPPVLLLEFTPDSDPSAETIADLLQNPKKIFSSGDIQPQAEKAGLGFYHCLTSASAALQGKLFLHTLSQNMYGIPSHQRAPMIPEAVKIATTGTKLLKEQADLLLFALKESKADGYLWNHFYSYLRKVVLPLSMAKRRKRSGGNPLTEGSLMESVARTFGAYCMRYWLAPDFDAGYAAFWGKVWAHFFSALEDGADHQIFRTPAKDDVPSVLHSVLISMAALRPDLIPHILKYFEFKLPGSTAEYNNRDISATMRQKLALNVSGNLRTGIENSLAQIASAGDDGKPAQHFLADLFAALGDVMLLQDAAGAQKIKQAFSTEILKDLA